MAERITPEEIDDIGGTPSQRRLGLGERIRMQSLAIEKMFSDRTAESVERAAMEEALLEEVEHLALDYETLLEEIGAPPHLTPIEYVRRMKAENEALRKKVERRG